MRRSESGFTLIELILVMATVAILFSVIIANVRAEAISNQIRSAASQIALDIERVRSAAVKTSKDTSFTLINQGQSYELRLAGVLAGSPVTVANIPDGVILKLGGLTTGTLGYSAPYGDSSATSRTLTVEKSGGTNQTFYIVGVTGKVIR